MDETETVLCKLVPVHRWHYDDMGLAWYHGFYMPIPLEPGESTIGAIECTKNYCKAMQKFEEATKETI